MADVASARVDRSRLGRRWPLPITLTGLALAILSGCSLLSVPWPDGQFPVGLPAPSPSASSSGLPRPSPSPKPRHSPRLSSTHAVAIDGATTYVWRGPGKKRWIALTFDLDMRPSMYASRDKVRWYDPRIIDLLERTGTPATIFLNGLFAKAYPDVLRRLAANPNLELANHSWDHQGWTSQCTPVDLPIKPPMTKRSEVLKTASIVKRLTGVRLRYFRFPAFCKRAADVRLVHSLGEVPIGTTCAFGDGLGYSNSRQVRNVQQTCGPGAIVVTHLNGPPYHDGVYEALMKLIPWWKKHGWRIVTVGTLLGHPTPR